MTETENIRLMLLIEGKCLVIRMAPLCRVTDGQPWILAEIHDCSDFCFDKVIFRLRLKSDEAFILLLEDLSADGLRMWDDFAFADQHCGICEEASWLQFFRIAHDPIFLNRISVVKYSPDASENIAAPKGWRFEGSLSERMPYRPPSLFPGMYD